MKDALEFVLDNYGESIRDYLGTLDIMIAFSTDCELVADKVERKINNTLRYKNFNYGVIQDYSLDTVKEVGDVLSDINFCEVDGSKFIKIITPFTLEKSYDFIIARRTDMKDLLFEINKRREGRNFKYREDAPVIGFDFQEIENETIKFLMNEDFRTYCTEHYIKLKRGIMLQGKPGTGKTLTLQWLRRQAEKAGIQYRQFKSVKELTESVDEYYGEGKKIFVFEDFDAALSERNDGNKTPNQILSLVLNLLEGVEEINDVVSVFTTNNIDVFDSAFIRPGRIDKVFDYNLPKREDYMNFFNAYIKAEEKHFESMADKLEHLSVDVSYATLKGICDDINIFKFSTREASTYINIEIIYNIIDEKISGANKRSSVGTTSSYIL